jgi:hypothetical protein
LQHGQTFRGQHVSGKVHSRPYSSNNLNDAINPHWPASDLCELQ